MKRAFLTGANGFIGRHLVARLHREGWATTVYDRKPASTDGQWDTYVQGDLFDLSALEFALCESGATIVFHLAALADVRNALKQPREQYRLNFDATAHVLEAMRAVGVDRIAFTSSAVVYGDARLSPITERGAEFPQQTSIYGAMKLASESLIAAYCHGYGMTADIYRLVSLTGPGYRHGNLMDFYQRLKANPTSLTILGSGNQIKYYIAVEDVIDAMIRTTGMTHRGAELWNVSHDRPNTIHDSIDAVCDVLGLHPTIQYGDDPWTGDLPALVLNCTKLRQVAGWAPTVTIADSMRATVRDFVERGL